MSPRTPHVFIYACMLVWFSAIPLLCGCLGFRTGAEMRDRRAVVMHESCEAGSNSVDELTLDLGGGVNMKFVLLRDFGFYGGKYEVTNGQFRRFRPKHDSKECLGHTLNGEGQPVVMIAYADVESFLDWLNVEVVRQQAPDWEARLPRGDEWRIMAQSGDSRAFPWGNEWPPTMGNYGSFPEAKPYDDGYTVTCPVEKSGRNSFGIYGLGGNVWEWTSDRHWLFLKARILRGGSWSLKGTGDTWFKCAALHIQAAPKPNIGFRVVLVPKNV